MDEGIWICVRTILCKGHLLETVHRAEPQVWSKCSLIWSIAAAGQLVCFCHEHIHLRMERCESCWALGLTGARNAASLSKSATVAAGTACCKGSTNSTIWAAFGRAEEDLGH